MFSVILFVLAAAAAVYLVHRTWGGSDSPTIVPPTPIPPSAVDPAARLLALSAQLQSVGDASSHPRDLATNPTFREGVEILTAADVPLGVVLDFATGANWMLATVACAALAERDDREAAAAAMARHFRHLPPWAMFQALQYFSTIENRPPCGALVLHGNEYWLHTPIVPGLFREHFERRTGLGDAIDFGDALTSAANADLEQAEAILRKVDNAEGRTLLDLVAGWRRSRLDRDFLQEFGRFIERGPETGLLVEHDAIIEPLAAAEAFLLRAPHRSILVVGEARSGKTSFLMLLAARAAADGWAVFEASAANLMSGQQYIGQLEERLRRLTTELSAEKRVIWYVPDFYHLAEAGRHAGQTASLLDQVQAAVAAGRIVLISETSAAALTGVLQRRPALRTALELVRLRPLTEPEANALARDVARRVAPLAHVEIAPDVVDTALHVTRHYLGSDQMPGAVLDLLKLTAQRLAAHDGSRMQRDDILTTLSQITGMPRLVLDDRERVELASIRRFFAKRVIGQDEAVDVVVDRIAMLKAGLTDPTKPVAVFLFAGPTGTGKTELAKTLAEFLFGSADRLIRLDMSEFQTVESTRKILGEADRRDDDLSLTHRIRRQPFSVVLLDEFEKAHPQAWDLFLQVFDDGRLTDAAGLTVDFRHCIIVLTSNLGATIQQQSGPGFVANAGAFSQQHVLRAVNQSFRPEFVNRLDAIIVFRPLTRELMRGILNKELSRVLERRGLRDREWAFEMESSALDFLLDKGFSPAMGARPLKRAIDRYLLAPLAATLVEHRFPEGDQFLFVRSDGRAIQVEFVDPDAPPAAVAPLEADAPAEAGPSLARMILQPGGRADERAAVLAELRRIESALTQESWSALEARLVADMQRPDFWGRAERFEVLARYAAIDRVKAALATARGLDARLGRSARDGRASRDLVSRLAAQLYLVQHGIDDVRLNAPVEIALSVQPVLDAAADPAATSQWTERVLDMYRRWALRRHMQWEDVGTPSCGAAMVVVSGFGAARILARECGLHVLEYELPDASLARAVARVRTAPTPATLPDDPAAKHAALLAELDRAAGTQRALRSAEPVAVVRRYRLDASPLVRDLSQGWRTGRHELVLNGDFDLLADVLGANA